jgi:hypothetical protein
MGHHHPRASTTCGLGDKEYLDPRLVQEPETQRIIYCYSKN